MMVQHTPQRPEEVGNSAMTANRFRVNLGKEAVKLALNGDWERAAEINRAILELHPDDCEAANRLAKALMELSDYATARVVLDDLCRRSPNNSIARKNLSRLEKLESAGAARPSPPSGSTGLSPFFIEDGGKSCTTTLRLPGDSAALAALSAGDSATLSLVGDSVVVTNCDGGRLGSLEPRLGRRLRKLIAGGNRYTAAIVGVNGSGVSVIIRESRQHPSLRNVVSFPASACPADPPGGAKGETPTYEELEVGDSLGESDSEETISALVADEIQDDSSGEEGDDDAVPVLDPDDVEPVPLPAFVSHDAEEWE
ncbi:MAG: tetratricopeptide repeat protein [Chloroflexi bacterium]|nr:tetratricopeptide repeat protein [Chloroflexota bacterium]MYD48568.1 tetratricopeptide repeat protein [Chloroflexota bacterium]